MRRYLIAGNWKMNLNRAGAVALAEGVAAGSAPVSEKVDLLVCPSNVYLDAVKTGLGDAEVALGAQDVYFETEGAFTGETSPVQLVDLGCRFVILGHSERRHVIGESDELINKKLNAALEANLTPILCVGETLSERESGKTMEVVESQFAGSLAGISEQEFSKIVIAYEPVWAIGTGKTATPQQAQEVHADLRKRVAQRYNETLADRLRILYGGSVKPDNAGELLVQPDIDGALIGGASLKADDFLAIAAAAEQSPVA